MINTQIRTTNKGLKETRGVSLLGVILYDISFTPLHFLRGLIFCLTPVDSVANSAVFPRNWACFKPAGKNQRLRVAVFGLLFKHMPLFLG